MKYTYPCPAGGPLVKVNVHCGDYKSDTLVDPHYHKEVTVDVPEEVIVSEGTEDETLVELNHEYDLYITATPVNGRGEQTGDARVLHCPSVSADSEGDGSGDADSGGSDEGDDDPPGFDSEGSDEGDDDAPEYPAYDDVRPL